MFFAALVPTGDQTELTSFSKNFFQKVFDHKGSSHIASGDKLQEKLT